MIYERESVERYRRYAELIKVLDQARRDFISDADWRVVQSCEQAGKPLPRRLRGPVERYRQKVKAACVTERWRV